MLDIDVTATFLRLQGVTNENRHQVIDLAKHAITNGGGWIVDFQQFSNLSINLRFELEGGNLTRFVESLIAAGIRINAESLTNIASMKEQSLNELKGSLQITFLHNDPDLRREVPPFG